MTNCEYAASLRQIADFYETNPDMKQAGDLLMFFYDRKKFLDAVKALSRGGRVDKRVDSPRSTMAAYHADRDFGGVKICMQIDRTNVCRLVHEAVYECPDSLLEAAAEYEEVA